MNATPIDAALRAFSIREYIAAARTAGRAQLDPRVRARAAALYDRLCEGRPDGALAAPAAPVAALAARVCHGEWFMARNPQPRYLAYTNVPVLHWALGADAGDAPACLIVRCRAALGVLLADLLDFERRSLAGTMPYSRELCDPATVATRLPRLEGLLTGFGGARESSDGNGAAPPDDWAAYITEAGRRDAIRHLTLFPQTAQHDEVLFLRAIHLTECCCLALLTGVRAALDAAEQGDLAAGSRWLAEVQPFADFLVPLFHLVKTMSPAHFAAFREATGDASAIQSRTYQLLQLATQGPDERKAPVLAAIPEVADLALALPGGDLRATVAGLAGRTSPDAAGFTAVAARLDRALYAWRALHFGIARGYLPDDAGGTGGTRGASYLGAHFTRRIIAASEPRLRAAALVG